MRVAAIAFAAGLAGGWAIRWATEPRDAGLAASAPSPAPADPASMPVLPPLAAPQRAPHVRARPATEAGAAAGARADAPHDASRSRPSAQSVALLARLEAEARDGHDGAQALDLAMHVVHDADAAGLVIPPGLVRELVARGGDYETGGVEMIRCLSASDVRAELLALAAGGAEAASWGTPAQREAVAKQLLHWFTQTNPADADVLALAGSKSPTLRAYGIELGAHRCLVTCDAALASARTDPDPEVRCAALGGALSAAGDDDAALARVADEIVAFARSDDPAIRAFGVRHLVVSGARGAVVAREVVDQGGLDADAYESAVRSLLAARRFDRLAPDGLDEESRARLVSCLADAYGDDPSTREQALGAVRSMGPPASQAEVVELMNFATDVGAPELVFAVAKDTAAASAVRVQAVVSLLEGDESRAAAVTLAGELLADGATPASLRRALVGEAGPSMAAAGDAGVAVLRRVAANDANAQVRGAAAQVLRDAGK